MGYDTLFFCEPGSEESRAGLWHLYFLSCSPPLSVLNATLQLSSSVFYRWENWGRVERWGQLWWPKKRAGEARRASALLNPCHVNWAASCAQWNLKRWLLCSLTQEELWAAKLPRGLCKQHCRTAGFMFHRASASWAAFCFSIPFLGQQLPLWGCPRLPSGEAALPGDSFATVWNASYRTVLLRQCVSLSLIQFPSGLFLSNTILVLLFT